MKITFEEAKIRTLQDSATAISAILMGDGSAGFVTRSAALRRLAAIERAKSLCEQAVVPLRQQLIMARGRQETLAHRAGEMRAEIERKQEFSDGLDAALTMIGKASGKD